MRDIQPAHGRGDQRRIGRIGDIPHFVGHGAVLTQQVGVAAQTLGQYIAVAQLHHARATLIGDQMLEVLRMARVGNVDDGRAVGFRRTGHGIEHLSVEVPCIRDHPVSLGVDGRLVSGAALQVVVTEPFGVVGVRPIWIDGAACRRRVEIICRPTGAGCDPQRQAGG